MRRLLTTAFAAAALLVAGATGAAAEPVPEFDFADCPALPAGADPALWRCEVLVSTGTLTFGRFHEMPVRTMRTTFAEGTLDGRHAQVFGALRAEPTPLPGPLPVALRPRYAGHFDFHENEQRKGEIDLAFALEGPMLPRTCASTPVHSVVQEHGPAGPVPGHPGVAKFGLVDRQLTVPATTGCGPLGRLLDRYLGLPSPAVHLQTVYVKMRGY
ncbi:hypothetical protein [Amycolatopsis suaedae]|uniref:hypothetical protein n=1 Tax=Amycolatopsis suaedae TaxID=2510978 RepID=UPI001F105018|nr:hypothetical protein [Amycolatopsis suaedae]